MTTPIKKLMLAAFTAISLCLVAKAANEDKTWMVIDLRTGARTYYGYDFTTATNVFNTTEYKTVKMVFRRVAGGEYFVQNGEKIANMEFPYYIGVFPVTEAQYTLICDKTASVSGGLVPIGASTCPWQNFRGTNLVSNAGEVGVDSPLGKLKALTGLDIDLPTIAMWEVAARAIEAYDETHKTWNWFFGETSDNIWNYAWGKGDKMAVGQKLPNAWGLYDLYGNVWEWCLDGGDYDQDSCGWGQTPCADDYNPGIAYLDKLAKGGGSDDDGNNVNYLNSTFVNRAHVGGSYPHIGYRLAYVCKDESELEDVYTITWKDYDGTTLNWKLVRRNDTPEYVWETPVRPEDIQNSYTFSGWSPAIGPAVSNTTYTATYTATPHVFHHVRWLNYDDTELFAQDVREGQWPWYEGDEPTRPSDAEYDYEFSGWIPAIENVYEDMAFHPYYAQLRRSYDVKWLDEDGVTELFVTNVPYGSMPEYLGVKPTKPSTTQYVYTFAGWTPEVEAVTGEATYTATFDESLREYLVRFYNYNNSEQLFTTNVPFGSMPEYFGETPTRPSTAQYHYDFAEWRDSLTHGIKTVDGPYFNDYFPTFDPVLRSYDIKWLNYDGSEICTDNMEYGAAPSYGGETPTRPSDDQYEYIFTGWDATITNVAGEASYTATYAERTRYYNITWKNEDGTVIDVTRVPYGKIPAHSGARKPGAGGAGYVFSGWLPAPEAVTGAAEYTATFRPKAVAGESGEGPQLVAHLSFDDDGNDGLNVLKATVGEDGIVRTTKANVVEGLGGVAPVTDAAILAGLPEGDGVVEIPLNTHIALPIPNVLSAESGHPYSMLMKVKFPSFGPYCAIMNMPADNNWDALVFLSNSTSPHIVFKMMGGATGDRIDGGGEGIFKAGEWETLLFLFDSGRTRVVLNGHEIFSYACSLSASRANCANAGGFILLSGDENGEDPLMYWADVKVYDGIVPDYTGMETYSATWKNWDGEVLEVADVLPGVVPSYNGAMPVKADDGNGPYYFAGWTPYVSALASNTVFTAKFVTFDGEVADEDNGLLLSEDFDGETLDPRISFTRVGGFNNLPGVKDGLGVNGTKAFGFGVSTCGSSAFDNYMTTLTVDFGAPTYVQSVEFDEMEIYGDWGSQGRVRVDGAVVDGLTFTKPGGNTQSPDTEFRHRSLELNRTLTTLSLQVHDITTASEEILDNLSILGAGITPRVVLWKNWDGTLLEADADIYPGSMPSYDGSVPQKPADENGWYSFAGWSPQVVQVTGNAVYTAQFEPSTSVIPPVTWRTVANGGQRLGWDYPVENYTASGETNTIKVLYQKNAYGKYPEGMMTGVTQMRLDGWFFVRREQARKWTFRQGYDDYMGLKIDGSWVLQNPTHNVVATGEWQATEGWHRFTIVCGDVASGYGLYTMNVGWAIAVSIDGQSYQGFEDLVRFGDGEHGGEYCTVHWQDEDGTVFYEKDNVLPGDVPRYDGPRPTKEGYVFTGWEDEESTVLDDKTLTAQWQTFDEYYDGYIKVGTAEELSAIRNNTTTNYVLTADIDLAGSQWTPIYQFSGVLDGNGHEIRNVRIAYSGGDDVGFFQFLVNATVKNLALRGGKVEGRYRVGGVVGRLNGNSLLENVTADLEVTAYGYEAGGIFGYASTPGGDRVVRCRSLCAVTTYAEEERVGGIGGKTDSNTVIVECYSSGSVTGFGIHGHVGGIVGNKNNGVPVISNCYTRVRRQGDYIANSERLGIGDANATILGAPDILDCFPKNIVNVRTRGNGSGTASYNAETGEFTATPDLGSVFIRWEGLPPEEGDFNETTVWAVFGKAVATEADLRAVASTGFYKQTADIEMTDSPAFYGLHYSPRFRGEYDGDGYGICNLTISGNNDYTGLFRVTQGAILKNIHLVGGKVRGKKYVGSLVGWQYAGVVEDCSSSCNVVATDIHAGGLVGVTYANYSTIRRCSASGSVSGYNSYVGGLTSYTNGGNSRIYDCYARGDVTANDYAGGFISHGDNAFVISNCYSTGRAKCFSNVGGFNWRDEGAKVTGCFWDMESSARASSGSGTGFATAEMKTAATFANWDDSVWKLVDGEYPTLWSAPLPKQFAVLKRGVGGGEVEATDNGDGTYTITATPNENSFFVRWSGTGVADETSPTTTVAVDGNVSVSAVFGKLIRTADELKSVLSAIDGYGYYKLANDIDLENTAAYSRAQFNGVFDGDGHEIRNIRISLTGTDDVALFYQLKDATVKNLALRGGKIEGRSRVAGIASRLWGGNLIENCTVDLELTAHGQGVGGIACWQEKTDVSDCIVRCRCLAAMESYTAEDRNGGIIGGTTGNMLIEECYATGSVTGHGIEGSVGGLAGWKSAGTLTISNSYHRVRLQGNYLGGDLYGIGDANATILGAPAILDCFPKNIVNVRTRGNGSGTASYNAETGEFTATPDEGSAFIRWEGLPPEEGEFNETTAWAVFGKAVATEADLRAVTAKGFYKQVADIEMTSSPAFYGLCDSPMFQGEYDGDGYAIRNLTIAGNYEYTGLFRRTHGAILKNIHLVGGNVKGLRYVGSLVGWQYAGIVEDCSSSCNVVATDIHGGGLAGVTYANYSTIRRCSASGSVTVYGSYAGGLTSYTNGGNTRIYDCYARGDVTANDYASGFISHGDGVFAISNCYSAGRVKCPTNAGGFNWRNEGAKVVGCFWDTEASGRAASGSGTGLATDEMKTAANFASWNAEVWNLEDGEYPTLKGAPALRIAVMKSGVGGGEVEATDNGDGTYTITATPDENSFFVKWSGTGIANETAATTTVSADGNVSATAVFGTLIRAADELTTALSGIDRFGHYKLANDIDLENTSARAAAQFNGVFDGDGHEIRNIRISLTTTDTVGLFAVLRNATIKNLSLRGGKIEGRHQVGGIAGKLDGGNLIENCTVDLEVVAHGYEAGGIFGYASSSVGGERIVRSRSLGAVTAYAGEDRAGGIGGKTDGAIEIVECYTTGSVTGFGIAGHVGGIIGNKNYGTIVISNCYTRVRQQGNYIDNSELLGIGDANAAIFGSPTVLDCFPKNVVNVRTRGNGTGTASYNAETGEFTATPDEGSAFIRWEGLPPEEGEFNETTAWAVFGKAVATEADLRAVTSTGFYKQTAEIDMCASGFVGLCYDPIFQGEYDGDGHGIYELTVEGNNDCSGLFRRIQGAVLKNIRLVGGTVNGRHYVGSLVGWQYSGVVEDCSSSCDVVATGNHGGGLVGLANTSYATIRRCAANGNVTISGSYAGGLISHISNQGGGKTRIYDCYSTGDVTANSWAGGFISHGDGNFIIQSCYSTGKVTAGSNVGGFYFRGDGADKVVGCFWDTETSALSTSGLGSGRSTAAMQTAATYAGWDGYEWLLVDGAYPELISLMGSVDAPTFTVTWVDDDGTVLRVDENVQLGRTPHYDGEKLPQRGVQGETYWEECYVHSGWYPSPTPVIGDVTYTAVYKEMVGDFGLQIPIDWACDEEELAWMTPVNVGSAARLITNGRGELTSMIAASGASGAYMYYACGYDLYGQYTGKFGVGYADNTSQASMTQWNLVDPSFTSFTSEYYENRATTNWWYWGSNGNYHSGRKNRGLVKDILWRPLGTVFTNTVTWVDVDGTVLKIERVVEGETPAFDGSVPAKAPNGDYSFSLAGWTPAVTEMTALAGDVVYTATYSYSKAKYSYTVTWEDADGTVLEVDENIEAGRTPSYDGATPTKAAEGGAFYTFAGWEPAIEPVNGDVTYRATYHESRKKTWMTIDLKTGAVGYWDLDFDTATNKFNTEEYKTTKMAFRRVEKGDDYFVQNGAYSANFTNSYYIGLFEVTVGQYTLMQNPSAYMSHDVAYLRTQGSINRTGVRGSGEAPESFGAGITETSPLGKLNAFVQGVNGDENLVFDFPTEAMWEVAARAVDSGNEEHKDWKYHFGPDNTDIALYGFLANSTAADDYGITSYMRVPGCRLPNAWGLYDMHGNARDVCLDSNSGEVDNWSLAPHIGGNRYWQRDRGGAYDDGIAYDASTRSVHDSGGYGHNGFRLARICTDAEELSDKCTVIWQNPNGDILQYDEILEGGHVRYHGDTPTMAFDGQKIYVFKGWTPEVSNLVTEDITYTAVYDSFNVILPDDWETAEWILDEVDASLRSKAIGHSAGTWVSLNVRGPGSLMFKWKVSSEGGYDWLRFYRGDSQLAYISGFPDWAVISNRVDETGPVTFKWAYTKDGSAFKGEDCGWIKDIVWLPDAQGTQVFVNGASVDFERSEDGKTITVTVPEETPAEEVPVKVGGVDVSRGFSRKVEGTIFTATLLAPYEVEKSPGVAEEPWTDNGDDSVTINVEVVPGLYYAAASATTLDGLSCPGADTPATGDTKLVVEKPASDAQGFYQVWVGDAPIKAD